MVTSVLQVTEGAAIRILHLRVARANFEEPVAPAILEVEDAMNVLDRFDLEKFKHTPKHAKSEQAARVAFRDSFQQKARSITEASSKRSKAKAKAKAMARRPMRLHCGQPTAKLLVPEGTSIWRDVTRGGWCAHCAPNTRISEACAKHGSSDAALKAVLRRLWVQFLDLQGRSLSACPNDGLFD